MGAAPAGRREGTYSGLSRSAIWRLISAGVVESKVLKNPLNPTAKRGARLVRLSSLLKAIEGDTEVPTAADVSSSHTAA